MRATTLVKSRTTSHIKAAAKKSSFKKGGASAYLFLLPTFVFIIVFSYYPAIRALFGAFTSWDGFNPPKFVGLSNFVQLFDDPAFLVSIWHVLVWTAIGIPLSIIPSFIVAEMIFHLPSEKAQYVYRTLFILSMVIPMVVGVLIWEFIYQPSGLLNQFLKVIGLPNLRHQWLASPHYALWSLIGMGFPWVVPFNLLILYAGLQSIPGEILDAASVDGTGGLSRILKIDIPLVFSQFKLLLILGIVGISQNLIAPLILTNGGPGNATMTPVLYMYQTAIDYGQYGYGMSIAFLIFIFVSCLAVINMKFIQSDN